MLVALALSSSLRGESSPYQTGPSLAREISSLAAPRLAGAPKLGDFDGLSPATELARKMLAVEEFVPREPTHRPPCTHPPHAHLGATSQNLYATSLALDSE